MRLRVVVDGRQAPLELAREAGNWRFRFDGGDEQSASVEQVEPGVYLVLWNGRSYEAKIEPGAGCLYVAAGGRRLAVAVHDPRRWDAAGKSRQREGRQNVPAPMPGRLVRLLVREGDPVEAGQGLAVVEAMKMQNEMKAPKAGRVLSLPVAQGETVSAGQVLAVIE